MPYGTRQTRNIIIKLCQKCRTPYIVTQITKQHHARCKYWWKEKNDDCSD